MNASDSSSAGGGTRRRLKVLFALICVGLIAVAAGVTLILTTPSSPSFGWFAYQPLSRTTFSPATPMMTSQGQIGLTIGVIGLVILSFSAGWAIGGRRRHDRP